MLRVPSRPNRPSLHRDADSAPRLLVSVRDAREACAALDGGAEILDVKEPARGALGSADPHTIEEVAAIAERSRYVPVTAACGEVVDWADRATPVPALPGGVVLAKLGPAGLATIPDWPATWCAVRARFDAAAGRALGWVAVIYADAPRCAAPLPEEILDVALHDAGVFGVLVDTGAKDGPGLTGCLSRAALETIASRVRATGRWLALAGKLSLADVASLAPLADILAVRSLACRAGLRSAEIDAQAVQEIRRVLNAAPSGESVPVRG